MPSLSGVIVEHAWWRYDMDTISLWNDGFPSTRASHTKLWCFLCCSLQPPLHRTTFHRPEKWSGRWVVAQTQKVLFLCNCYSTIPVPSLNHQDWCSGTTGRAKEAEWRQNHCHGDSRVAVVAEWRQIGRHSDRSMDAIGRPKEAQWWYKEGRSIAQIDTLRLHQYACFTGRSMQWPTTVNPFCDHGGMCAFLLPHLSDPWATNLRGDLCATVLNMLKTSRRPWRCLNVLCASLERPRQPFGVLCAFNGDLASFVVVQVRHKGRSPCVKGA